MFSPDLMKFLITHDIEEYLVEQKQKTDAIENKIFRYSKFATIPIEVKEQF